MVTFTKKFGQLKQWTGEKLGNTAKTQKPMEIKQLQTETASRFDGLQDIRNSLKEYVRALDDNKESSMGMLAHAIASQSHFHGQSDFGAMLLALGDGLGQISGHQNAFAEEIRLGLLMSFDALLNETTEFEHLRKKLKNRRLDFDANSNKLQKSKKEDPALEESVKTTQYKYEETLKKLEDMMVSVSVRESELITPVVVFAEAQALYYQHCLQTSEALLSILREGMKPLDSALRMRIETDVADDDTTSSSDVSALNDAASLYTVRANYDFEAENKGEMSIHKGDMIRVTKVVDEGWWIGTCNGQCGMFPSNYVTRISDEEPASDAVVATKPQSAVTHQPKAETEEDGHNDVSQREAPSAAKPGFSYLPQGAPITFIGRKAREAPQTSADASYVAPASCGDCDCDDFAANVFKPGHCNNCFHKH